MPTSAWLTPKFISRLEALELSVRWVRAGNRLGGRFAINRRGSSIEFADYAAYSAGDDIRAIDWNLYARLDRLYIKTYKEEIQLAVEMIIDATASMGLPTPEKFERAKRLAICFGYIALAGGHQLAQRLLQGALGGRPHLFVARARFRRAENARVRQDVVQRDRALQAKAPFHFQQRLITRLRQRFINDVATRQRARRLQRHCRFDAPTLDVPLDGLRRLGLKTGEPLRQARFQLEESMVDAAQLDGHGALRRLRGQPAIAGHALNRH